MYDGRRPRSRHSGKHEDKIFPIGGDLDWSLPGDASVFVTDVLVPEHFTGRLHRVDDSVARREDAREVLPAGSDVSRSFPIGCPSQVTSVVIPLQNAVRCDGVHHALAAGKHLPEVGPIAAESYAQRRSLR